MKDPWNGFGQHKEKIQCPECKVIQEATVIHSYPWYTMIHECEFCGYTIMESEWIKVNE